MNQSQKGKKGFQKLPENEVKSERYNYKLTKAELSTINNYCKSNDMTKADFFKQALNDFFIKKGITITTDEVNNPNQLTID